MGYASHVHVTGSGIITVRFSKQIPDVTCVVGSQGRLMDVYGFTYRPVHAGGNYCTFIYLLAKMQCFKDCNHFL